MLAVAVMADVACVPSKVLPLLATLAGLGCDALCASSGIRILSATLRMGSLSLSGVGASEGLLIPPPPINDCIASTAGFGLDFSAAICCLRLFASAAAACPVSGMAVVAGK